MTSVPKYGRIQITVPDGCESAIVTRPDGVQETVPVFVYQPTRFVYDRHGYETQQNDGAPFSCFRYSPEQPGVYRYKAVSGGRVAGGLFGCDDSDHPGFVGISKKDPRYFATDDGHTFVPIGLNLCVLRPEHPPRSKEHFVMGDGTAWTGMTFYKRWIRRLAENGVNYVRIWLSSAYLDARTQLMGTHDAAVFNRLDAIMDLLRENGMRAKLCLEHFRYLTAAPKGIFDKCIIDPDTGRPLESVAEWTTQEKWNTRWIEDIMPYIARYQNDPAVFAWELWNEINCLDTTPENIIDFNRRMIDRVKALSPKNMVANSLGSYDREEFLTAFMIPFRDTPGMPFMPIHRYLDQGAPLEICGGDTVALVADAFRQIDCRRKPCVLNETGAVNDCHTGPFRFYPCDDDGLIFHDLTYAPFFCGAAASGHIWHWESYVEPKNLWRHFRPFSDMLKGIEADEEDFRWSDESCEKAQILRLDGRCHTLFYIRNRADNWQNALRDQLRTPPVEGLRVAVPDGRATIFWLMNESHETSPSVESGAVTLPAFLHGCVLRIDRQAEAMKRP